MTGVTSRNQALSYRQTEAAHAVIAAAMDQPKPTPELRAALAAWTTVTTPLPMSWGDPALRAFAPAHVLVGLQLRDTPEGITATALAARIGQSSANVRDMLGRYCRSGHAAHDGGWPRVYRWTGGEVAPPHGTTLAIVHALIEHGPARAADIAPRIRRYRCDVTKALRALEVRGLARQTDGRWHLVRMAIVRPDVTAPDVAVAA